MEDTNRQDKTEIAKRLVIRRDLFGSNPYYEVLKPHKNMDCFEPYGRRYEKKQIATLYHQNTLHPKFEFTFEPPQLQSEIEELVKEYMPKMSEAERETLRQQHKPRTN